MAGSRTGWIEAPYVRVPAALDTIAAGVVRFTSSRGRAVHMLPGLCTMDEPSLATGSATLLDVMRGEETQIVGAATTAAGRDRLRQDGRPSVLCLPGTHCKWVVVDDASAAGGSLGDVSVRDFATHMTG